VTGKTALRWLGGLALGSLMLGLSIVLLPSEWSKAADLGGFAVAAFLGGLVARRGGAALGLFLGIEFVVFVQVMLTLIGGRVGLPPPGLFHDGSGWWDGAYMLVGVMAGQGGAVVGSRRAATTRRDTQTPLA
jgi:hypothetical protein